MQNACVSPKEKYLRRHITPAILDSAKNIANAKGSYSGIQFFDSVYGQLNNPSIYDQVKRLLFMEEVSFANSAQAASEIRDTGAGYADSAAALIEATELKEALSEEYIDAFRLKGEHCLFLRQYSEAVKFISRARFISRESGDSCQTAKITALLGNVAWQQKKYSKAADLFEESVSLFNYCKSGRDRFYLVQGNMDNTGISLLRSGRPEEGIHYLKKTEQYILQNKHLCLPDTVFHYEALIVVYSNIADGFEMLNMPDSSKTYIDRAFQIKQQYLHRKLDANDYVQASGIELAMKRYGQANSFLKLAAPELMETSLVTRADWYRYKAAVSHYLGNIADEADCLKKYSLIKDTLINLNSKLLDSDPDREYEKLIKQFELEKATSKTKINQLYFYAALIILLLIVIFSIQVWQSLTKSRKLNSVLAQREAELELLLSEINARKDSEKREELFSLGLQLQESYAEKIKLRQLQISNDMHDELSASLAALRYYIGDVKGRAASEHEKIILHDIEEEISSIYENTRLYMHNLRNQALAGKYDLPGFLSDLRDRFLEKNLLQINFQADEVKLPTLSLIQNNSLYFIVKEALANIIKHSSATIADIEIRFNGSTCHFSIRDNGAVSEIKGSVRGMGLDSMETRIKEAGGKINFIAGKNGVSVQGSFQVDIDQLPDVK
ncbi:MAG: hypothetical protein JNM14_12590 [Ferruginibacter sp.]|nr:hypothetical protein [Ferruginibacter sp.]